MGQVEDRATETERRKRRGEEQENEKMGGHRRVAAGGPALASAAAVSSRASRTSTVIGFSMKTWRPALRLFMPISACLGMCLMPDRAW